MGREDEPAKTSIPLLGPGDIVGLDRRTIVRVFPQPDDNDVEHDFFPCIEFDQPDLPWRYTPAKATGDPHASNDRLRPWLTLITLEEETEISSFSPPGPKQKLPTITVDAAKLPDLAHVWAWAHVQIAGQATTENLDALFSGPSAQVVSRIISPRLLKEKTAYRAFLVPTFERGRRVGTGQSLKDGTNEVDGLALAWGASGAVTLPVYHDWRFQTGAVGSFQDLVLALERKNDLGAEVGSREMDVSAPGMGLGNPQGPGSPPATPEDKTVSLGGALWQGPTCK